MQFIVHQFYLNKAEVKKKNVTGGRQMSAHLDQGGNTD